MALLKINTSPMQPEYFQYKRNRPRLSLAQFMRKSMCLVYCFQSSYKSAGFPGPNYNHRGSAKAYFRYHHMKYFIDTWPAGCFVTKIMRCTLSILLQNMFFRQKHFTNSCRFICLHSKVKLSLGFTQNMSALLV